MLFYTVSVCIPLRPVDTGPHVVLAEAHRSLPVPSRNRTWQQSAAEHSRVVFILLDVYFAL